VTKTKWTSMTTDDLLKQLEEVREQERALGRRRYEIVLALEEQEGRGNGREAEFARAFLADDIDTMMRHCAEDTAEEYKRTGQWTAYQHEAQKILAKARGES